jgi:hypothetical protein
MELERFIGWITFALGVSATQPNDSTFYRVVETSGVPAIWIGLYCAFAIALIVSTYRPVPRCRVALLSVLLLLWSSGIGLVIAAGPMGAFGAVGLVVCVFILRLLWSKVRADDAFAEP